MSASIEEELKRMLEVITINTALPMYIDDLDILLDHKLYFDICEKIFHHLRMKLIKIDEDEILTPA